jgi:hypothetical protein
LIGPFVGRYDRNHFSFLVSGGDQLGKSYIHIYIYI